MSICACRLGDVCTDDQKGRDVASSKLLGKRGTSANVNEVDSG